MSDMARVALKLIICFEVLTTIALIIHLAMVNVLKPGVGMNVDLPKVDTLYRANSAPGRCEFPDRFCSQTPSLAMT
jgi:Na+/H+-dicarboxylate symporter